MTEAKPREAALICLGGKARLLIAAFSGGRSSAGRGARFAATVAVLLGILALSACGYRVASKQRFAPPVRSIAVRPLENETTTYQVEQILTRALVRGLVKRSGLAVYSSEEDAQAVLSGRVLRVVASPVTFQQSAFAITFLVTVEAAVEIREKETDRVLFKQDRLVFQERYIVNTEVEDFFSELNPALERLGRDFADSVIATWLEDF